MTDKNTTAISLEFEKEIARYIAFEKKHFTNDLDVLVKSYLSVSNFFNEKEEFFFATKYYKEALTLVSTALKKEDSEEYRELLRSIIGSMLRSYSCSTHKKKAIKQTEELISWQKKENNLSIKTLSYSYESLAQLYYKDNNKSIMIDESYRKAIEVLENELEERNSTVEVSDLIDSYTKFAYYCADEGEDNKAIGLMEELLDNHLKKFPKHKKELATVYDKFSDVYLFLDNNSSSLEYKEKAVLTLEEILVSSEKYEESFYYFRNLHSQLQRVYAKEGKKKKVHEEIKNEAEAQAKT